MIAAGIVKVKNDLANSQHSCQFTKPVDQYVFKALEKNEHGALCVVIDGNEAIGIVDVVPADIESYTPLPQPKDVFETLVEILFNPQETADGPPRGDEYPNYDNH